MGKRYSFGDGYMLDTDLCQLFQHGQRVRLGPTPYKLLLYLIEHRTRTIDKDTLIAGVWSEHYVSEQAFNECLSTARKAVEDSGEKQQVIENVRTYGYRFCADVEEQATPEPGGATALQGNLVLRIWEPGNPGRQGLSLEARGVLPLQPRDRVRLTAEVNRAAYLYLIWIDSEGKPVPLFPWRPGNWEERLPHEQPLTQVSLPEEEEGGWSLEGVSGMETLLLLARETPLPADVYLHTFLEVLPCTEGRSLYRPLWFENWVPQPRSEFRSIDVSRTYPIIEIAHDRHRVLQHRLAVYFSYSLSVSFPYAGDVTGKAQRAE